MASIVAVYLVLTWARSMHLFATNRNSYEITFKDVNGLKAGDAVTVFGHPSGNVTDIRIGKDGAIVTIGLEADVALYEDVWAEILVKELIGGKQIDLKPGSGGKVLPNGSQFMGHTSLDFSSAFSKFGDFLDRFGEERIDSIFTNFNRLARIYGDIGHQIENENIGGLFEDLSSSASSLHNILGQMESRRIMVKVDSAMYTLTTLSKKADEALGSVTALSDKIQATTLPKADELMTELLSTLNQTESVIVSMRDLLTQLKDTRTAAGKFIYDPAFAANIDYTIDNFNKTLDHLRNKKVMITFTLSKKNTGDTPK